jgi:hypothetical protein
MVTITLGTVGGLALGISRLAALWLWDRRNVVVSAHWFAEWLFAFLVLGMLLLRRLRGTQLWAFALSEILCSGVIGWFGTRQLVDIVDDSLATLLAALALVNAIYFAIQGIDDLHKAVEIDARAPTHSADATASALLVGSDGFQ